MYEIAVFKLKLWAQSVQPGSVLVNDFWTPPTPPPAINFVHGSDRKCLNLT